MKNIKEIVKLPTRRGLDFNRRRSKRDYDVVRGPLFLCIEIAAAVGIGFLVAYSFFCRVNVSGVGMEPTLLSGEGVLINRISSVIPPARGTVVAFSTRTGQISSVNIKRVVGLPGDSVIIEGGTLYINGKREENAETFGNIDDAGILKNEYTIPAGEYFLLGDNRNNSEDSRYESIGTVSKGDIIGSVWLCVSQEHFGPVS